MGIVEREGEVPAKRTELELFKAIRSHLSVSDLCRAVDESGEEVEKLFDMVQSLLARRHNERVVIYTDGAARGNPGPAGAGVVIETCSGKNLALISEFLGEMTNNMAEYQALLLGMRKAVELGVTSVVVRSDSELMVQQMRGVYRVKNRNLLELHKACTSLVSHFEEFAIEHVERRTNTRADALANNAIDAVKRQKGAVNPGSYSR